MHVTTKLSLLLAFSAFLLYNDLTFVYHYSILILLIWLGMIFGSAFVPINNNLLLESC